MDKVKMPIHRMFVNTESKDGRKYKAPLVRIETDEDLVDDPTFNGWVSFFDNNNQSGQWKEDMEVEVELVKVEKDGATFWNIHVPSRWDMLEERVEKLEKVVFKQKKEDIPF